MTEWPAQILDNIHGMLIYISQTTVVDLFGVIIRAISGPPQKATV